MKALNRTALIAAMAGLFAASFTSSAAWAATTYTVTDLGTLGGTWSQANGINASGQVVGQAAGTPGDGYHAFLYSGSTMTDLGTFGSSWSEATGINDSGQVVGVGVFAGNVLLSGSTMTGWGTCINASGQVAGNAYPPGNVSCHAFLYSGSTMTDLGTLGGTDSYATGINASGQVVGYAYTPGNVSRHAFLYSGSTMTGLGTLGGTCSWAYGINASGQVVGGANTPGDASWHAFLYSGSTMTDLGTLGGTDSYATGINASGQVVGDAFTPGDAPSYHPFVYYDGTMKDLNSLLTPASTGYTVSSANAINNRGQIAATAITPTGQSHAVLLTPVFTPFSQNDPSWKDLSYAGGTYKIGGLGGKGCALTSLTMALTGAGIAEDPAMLNSLMLANGGYNKGGNVDWGTAVKTAAKAASAPDVTFHGKRSSSTTVLDNLLDQGHPVIVGVHPSIDSQGQTVWGHFVVVTGKQPDGNYTIADPGYSGRTTLASYNNVFETRGYVADPPNVSEIDMSVVAPGSGVNLLLTDSHGNKTGIDGTGGRFELIPGSAHFIDAIVGVDSDQPATDVSQYIQVEHPELGDYGIEIRGIDAGSASYSLMETAFAPDGSQLWSKEISGVVAAGSVDQYSITYATPEPATLAGDANGDGTVSFSDYQTLEANFGTGTTWAQGDFNGDGAVTFADYQILEANFGKSSVPEPATLSLLVLGGFALIRRRRE